MFIKFFIKEWRDNRLLLSVSAFLLAALIIIGLADSGKTAGDVVGLLLLLVLLLTAMFLGSGAFASEFKNEAWTYLFSRPVRRSAIWIYKYLALLGFLAAAFLIMTLAVRFLPGLKNVRADIFAPSFLGNLALYSLGIFLAFTISYSLSILSEKPLLTFAVSVLIEALLFWLYFQSLRFFEERYAYWGNSAWLGLFIAASFILASILTFARVDFSQGIKKHLSFTSLVLLFMAISFLAGTLIISKGRPFANPILEYWNSYKAQGFVYLGTHADRTLRYDPKDDSIRKIRGIGGYSLFETSLVGDKIAFIKVNRSRIGTSRAEAVIVSLDGTHTTTLARFYGADSAFNGWTPDSNILISPSGRQVAFVASPPSRNWQRNPPHVFWMNIDGSGFKDRTLDFYRKGRVEILSWFEEDDNLVLRLAEKAVHSLKVKILKLGLYTGVTRAYEMIYPSPGNYEWMPPLSLSFDRKSLIIRVLDEVQNKEKSMVLDLGSFETQEIGADVPMWRLTWSPQSDKFLFPGWRMRSLWAYSLADHSPHKIMEPPDKNTGFSFDWMGDGRRVVVLSGNQKETFLTIYSENFSVEKTIKCPDQIARYSNGVFGLESKILVVCEEGGAWRLDLKTEDWKKVY